MAITKASRRNQQPQPATGAAFLAMFGQLITAVNRSGDGEAISQVRDAVCEVADQLAPMSSEKLSERISETALNVAETLTYPTEITEFVSYIGWAFTRGCMSALANKGPDGSPMTAKESE